MTQGTGANMVKDISSGTASSSPQELVNVNGTLFFTATESTGGRELYKSNGLSAGTVRVVDIVSGSGSSTPLYLTNVNGLLYFTASTAANGRELWRSDGTTAQLITDIISGTGSSDPQYLTAIGNTVYFSAIGPTQGRELWKASAGGASLVADLNPGGADSSPDNLVAIGSGLYFRALNGRTFGLWKTDGATVTQLGAGNPDLTGPDKLCNVNGILFFSIDDQESDWKELWRSNGTDSGTLRVTDFFGDGKLSAKYYGEEGDGVITSEDAGRLSSSQNINTFGLTKLNAAQPIRFDLTSAVKDFLSSGKTRMTIGLELTESTGSAPLKFEAIYPATDRSAILVTTENRAGVRADLLGENGAVLFEDREVIDMRTLEAGTYFLRVYNPFEGQALLPFSMEFLLPSGGDVHPSTDNDRIFGGEGSDIIVGHGQLDYLEGGQGNDTFFGEAIEVKDLNVPEGDYLSGPADGNFEALEATAVTQAGIRPLDFEATITNDKVLLFLAEATGTPITQRWLGNELVDLPAEPILASQIAQVTRLDAGFRNLSDLSGLEYAVNLRSLDLSGNPINDLSALRPGSREGREDEGQLGLLRIETLALDSTLINNSNLNQVATFAGLKTLSLDNTSVNDLTPLSALQDLEFLSMDQPLLSDPDFPFGGSYNTRSFANPTPTTNDTFGYSIAGVGQNILVGAYGDSSSGASYAGAAYLYDGTTGALLRTFTSPSPIAQDYFGYSVAAVGQNILVGAYGNNTGATDAGTAYLFDGTTGALLRTFTNPTPVAYDYFGYSVAAVGQSILIGVPYDDTGATDAGAVYLFDGTTGALLRTFTNPTPAGGDYFGYAIASVGQNVLVGARNDDTGATNAGAVYLFDGSTGALLQTFTNPTPALADYFGYSVAAVGENVLISAPYDDAGATDAGSPILSS
jgi:ELWxxDGT repeat protein